ncbi:MAG: hypothetical protein FJ222_09645 [Lentisphaerae bacterium]|nr:hypothetical protein [Lentisphaerota bacterium]
MQNPEQADSGAGVSPAIPRLFRNSGRRDACTTRVLQEPLSRNAFVAASEHTGITDKFWGKPTEDDVDKHAFVWYHLHVFSSVKAVAVAVTALFLIASALSFASHDHAHEHDSASEIATHCCSNVEAMCDYPAVYVGFPTVAHVTVVEDVFHERLSIVEIYRPPIVS